MLKLSFLVVEGLNYRVSLAKLYPFNDVPELKEQNISSLKRHGLLLLIYLDSYLEFCFLVVTLNCVQDQSINLKQILSVFITWHHS